jgi:hypothetical protein
MPSRLTLAIAAALLAHSASALASGVNRLIIARSGMVTASVDFHQSTDRLGNQSTSAARLQITRSGVSFYSQPVSSRFCASGCGVDLLARGGPLAVRDLDGDGAPEVILDLYTGGAHCCSVVQILQYSGGLSTYRLFERNFGDPGARLLDLRGDGQLQLRSGDDRFAYQFAPYAYSGLPPQIWRFSAGRLIDVTRRFPRLIAADAKQQFGRFINNRRAGFGLGFIAAWTADEALLGRRTQAARVLIAQQHAGQLSNSAGFGVGGAAFISKLWRFLRRTGYV